MGANVKLSEAMGSTAKTMGEMNKLMNPAQVAKTMQVGFILFFVLLISAYSAFSPSFWTRKISKVLASDWLFGILHTSL